MVIILLVNSPCWLFQQLPRGRLPCKAVIKATDERWAERGVLSEGGKRLREKETDTRPVSNQRSCGAEFKAGMGQTSKLLEFCHLSLPPPTSPKKGKKEKRGGRAGGGRKDVNENQTHSPVWSGREQWGGWCHKSGAGLSPYLFLRVAISPSTSVGPFFLHVSWFEILFLFNKKKKKKKKNNPGASENFFCSLL